MDKKIYDRKIPSVISSETKEKCFVLEDPNKIIQHYGTGNSWSEHFANFRNEFDENFPWLSQASIIAAFKMTENYVKAADAYDALRKECKFTEGWYDTFPKVDAAGILYELHRVRIIRLVRPGDKIGFMESYASPLSIIIEVPYEKVYRAFPLSAEEQELYKHGRLTYSRKDHIGDKFACYIKHDWKIMSLGKALELEKARLLAAPLDPEPEDPWDDIYRHWGSVKDVPTDLTAAVEHLQCLANSNVDGIPVVPSAQREPDRDLWLLRKARPMQPMKKRHQVCIDGVIYEDDYVKEGLHVRVETCKKAVLGKTGRLEIERAVAVEDAWNNFLATLDEKTRLELETSRLDLDTYYCPYCGKAMRFPMTVRFRECPHCENIVVHEDAYTIIDVNPDWVGRDEAGDLVIDIAKDPDNDFGLEFCGPEDEDLDNEFEEE